MKLCKCNKCDVIFEDMNPNTDQREYEIPEGVEVDPLILCTDEESKPLNFWGCPVCKTDSDLIDFEGEICETDYRIFECGKSKSEATEF